MPWCWPPRASWRSRQDVCMVCWDGMPSGHCACWAGLGRVLAPPQQASEVWFGVLEVTVMLSTDCQLMAFQQST